MGPSPKLVYNPAPLLGNAVPLELQVLRLDLEANFSSYLREMCKVCAYGAIRET